jgi:adenosine deaminase
MNLDKLIRELPKAELHLHIEGTLEPELMFEIAERNSVPLRFNSIEEVRAAYQFDDLQTFLDIYYEGARVLQQEQDFYDLTWAYLTRVHKENVRHVEIFSTPKPIRTAAFSLKRWCPAYTKRLRKPAPDSVSAPDSFSVSCATFLRHRPFIHWSRHCPIKAGSLR